MEIDIRQRSASTALSLACSRPQIPHQNTAFVRVDQIAKSIKQFRGGNERGNQNAIWTGKDKWIYNGMQQYGGPAEFIQKLIVNAFLNLSWM